MILRQLAIPALAAVLTLAAAACNGSEETGAAGETSPVETTAPATEATEATETAEPTATGTGPTPDATDTGTVEGQSTPTAGEDLPEASTDATESSGFPDPLGGDIAYLDEVEIGDHEDYERVVFTFTDDSPVPAWRVAYTDEITQPGSGNPVDVDGEAFLHVILSGGTGVDMTGETFEEVYTGPDRLPGSDVGASAITEVVLAGDFEATMEWGIGLDEERPFRAFMLEGPSRVVVDVLTQ